MLRFDANPKRAPRNYLARGEQLRLLILVSALAGVALLMSLVHKPQSVAVLDRLFGGGEPEASQVNDTSGDPAGADASAGWLEQDQLDTIRDNTHFRNAETDAWFALIARLQDDPSSLESVNANAPLSYAQLVRQPDVYRGRALRVAGEIRRVERVKPAEHSIGLDAYYRVVLRPQGREAWPIIVYSVERPDGVPLDEPVRRAATASGVFFKNLSYRSEAGMGLAPVVLSRTVHVAPLATPAPRPNDVSLADVVKAIVVAALVSAALVLLALLWRAGPSRPAAPKHARLDFDRLAAETPSAGDDA